VTTATPQPDLQPSSGAVAPDTRIDPTTTPPVVLVNQYYAPDVASTGLLLHELALTLGRAGVDVSVLSTRPSYGPPESWVECPSNETIDGVKIRRMWTSRLSKDKLLWRAFNYFTFTAQLTLRLLFGKGSNKVFMYSTSPPYLGTIGAFVSMLRRHTYIVLLYDSFPHLATWVGTIKRGGLVERIWHWGNRLGYRRAAHTIVLCQAAKKLVCENYGVDPARVHVIPNWSDKQKLSPKPKSESAFAKAHNLIEPFVSLYSGNIGLYYDFDTILKAAEILKEENFKMVFVGSGGRKQWLADEIKSRNTGNSIMLPYQPLETLNDSLNGCDAHFVTIARGIEGISFPSKLYSTLAVGKPILAISEKESELRTIIESNNAGLWFELGDGEGLARGIRWLRDNPENAEEMGKNARLLFEREYTRELAGKRYAEIFRLAKQPRPRT
jgi:glycosyltransferase involved in cell wall biosynthesis